MIFNVSQGGVSVLSVTAPSGASISATCQGLTVTGTGTCDLDLPIIGTWDITCVYDGVTKTDTQEVTGYGEQYYVYFTYEAYLVVMTFPGSTVSISKTGYSDSQTATGGSAVFVIPAGQLGTYSITSAYSSWSGSASQNVSSYDDTYTVPVWLSVPDFKFVVGGTTYTFTKDSSTGSNSDYYFYKDGADWEFYMKNSGTLTFTNVAYVDLFLLGGGYDGVNSTGYNTCAGGDGGKRRTISNILAGGNYDVTVGASNGGVTSCLGYDSDTDAGTGGQSKGSSATSQDAGDNGGYSFGSSSAKGPDGNSRRVGAGGGHGAYAETDGTTSSKNPKTNGGNYGAGDGGDAHIDGSTWYANNGDNATWYGGGGGGAGVYYHSGAYVDRRGKGNPGSGYKGFAAIRNNR